MMTNILTNQYWAYGQAPDIRFTLAYDMQRVGADAQYKFYWTIHSLNTPTSGFGWPIYATVYLDGSTKLNGVTIKGTSPMKWYGTELHYESSWVTVSNKTSGTTAFRMTMFSGSGMDRSQTWNASIAVPDPSSSFSVPDIVIGSPVTVTINKAKDSYRHTVKIELGSNSKTQTDVDSSFTYTVPIAWCRNLPESTSGTAKVYVTTYEGSTQIGTQQVKEVTATVPSSVVPRLSSAITRLNGIGNNLLAGYSRIKLDAIVENMYYATTKDITFTIGNETISGTSESFTSDVLNTVGTVNWSIVVTDSRGRTSKASSSVTVLSYTPPKITSATVRRADASGAFKESGTACYVKANATYDSDISGNSLTLNIQYKELSSGYYSGEETIQNGVGSVHYEGLITLQKSYNILITATDAAGISAEYVATITSSSNYMLTAKGKKCSIGGYVDLSKSDGLQVAGDLHVSGRTYAPTTFYRLLNEVVESGGTRYTSLSLTYSFFVVVVMRSNGIGGRHTEYVPSVYIDVERIFSPYIYNGNKDFSLQYADGTLTVKNQSADDLRLTVYGVV